MKGQSCPVRVQRSRMNCHNRGAEDIDVVLVRPVTKMPKESIPGSTVIGEVADSDNAFIAIFQLPSACVQLNIIVVKFQVPLAQIKDIAHVRSNMPDRKPQRVRIDKLRIGSEVRSRPDGESTVYARQLVNSVVA